MEGQSTGSMAVHDGMIDTSQRGVRVRLGLFLAMSYLTAEFLVIALHEGAHAIAYKICGAPIYGIYLSPFAGQVLGSEWGPPGAARAGPEHGMFSMGDHAPTRDADYRHAGPTAEAPCHFQESRSNCVGAPGP